MFFWGKWVCDPLPVPHTQQAPRSPTERHGRPPGTPRKATEGPRAPTEPTEPTERELKAHGTHGTHGLNRKSRGDPRKVFNAAPRQILAPPPASPCTNRRGCAGQLTAWTP